MKTKALPFYLRVYIIDLIAAQYGANHEYTRQAMARSGLKY